MCFSPVASFIAGSTLSAVGGVTMKKARIKNEIPFAAIPLLIGMQQIAEGIVWLSFGIPLLNQISTFFFAMFAFVIWPIYVPFAILMIETDPSRKKILKFFQLSGIIAGMILLYAIIRGPVASQINQNSISYTFYDVQPIFTAIFYMISTVFSCLFSSHRTINIFGVTLFFSCFFAYECYTYAFFSVWCFFAAILSIIVYLHFTQKETAAFRLELGRKIMDFLHL